ncbi:MAG: CPBP family intramembrane glutamic endopeptidase [Sphingomicrobium sp.]
MATKADAGMRSWARLRRNALIQLAIMAGCVLVWLIAFRGFIVPALKTLGPPGSFIGDGMRLMSALVYAAGALLIYHVLIGWIERRPTLELSRRPGVELGLAGFAIGMLLFFLAAGVGWLAGWARPIAYGGTTYLIAVGSASLMAAVGEEVLFRGILFRIVERAAGTSIALLVSALFFGLAHLANPDSTLLSSIVIAIEAGLLLGLAYAVSHNLWFPIGIHFAWNFTEGGIFGASGSDGPQHGLIQMAFSGPDWLTGGALGLGGSLIALVLCVGLAFVFALLTRKHGNWAPTRLRIRLD